MKKSPYVKSLDEIQKAVHSFLKPLKFKKTGRSHNRCLDKGIVQVINFQMGPYPIGDYEIEGLRENLYGKFIINLGIHLPCIYEIEHNSKPPKVIKDYDCTIRERIGTVTDDEEAWFEIPKNPSDCFSELVNIIDNQALPFLDQFKTYESIIKYYEDNGELPFSNESRSTLEVAIISNHIGDSKMAKKLFSKAFSTDHEGFRDFVKELATKCGYSVV